MKFYTYAVILVGIIMLLNIGGIQTPVGGGLAKALNLVSDNQEIVIDSVKSSSIWISMAALFAALSVGGIVIGSFGKSPDIRYFTGGIVSTMTAALIADLVFIWTEVAKNGAFLATAMGLLIGGFLAGLVISAFEFWQNAD